MRFEFATASRIIFGAGTLREVAPIASEMGRSALVVTGHTTERAAHLLDQLKKQKMKFFTFCVTDEPTIESTLAGVKLARENKCEFVIGIGGGSVLDVGKTVAALLTNGGDLLDYLEIIGQGKPLTRPLAPYIAIPTTAGTGSEVTRNAVLFSPEHQVKVSLRSPFMLPKLSLVDPELTFSLPPAITAASGLDALTQLIEPFVSNRANPFIDTICYEGMRRVAWSLRQAYEQGNDVTAREDMAIASLFSGLALANAGLGAVHGFAGPIGGMFHAPHGAICARLLPFVMSANIEALKTSAPNSSTIIERYDQIAKILTGNNAARTKDGIDWVHHLCADLNIPTLSAFSVKAEDIPAIVVKAKSASSMKGNPIVLTDEELSEILLQAL